MDLNGAMQETYQATMDAMETIPSIVESEPFGKVVDLIHEINEAGGKVVMAGIGKSGLVAKSIVATLVSTGTKTVFLNPVEAVHGDIGIVTSEDVVFLISNSGNTAEVITLLNAISHLGVETIALTGNTQGVLAQSCDHSIVYKVESEGYLNLPPLASTTVTMTLGQLLATALMAKRGFDESDFALFHPGGSLGKQMLFKLENIMTPESLNEDMLVSKSDNLSQVIEKMNRAGKGGVVVVSEGKLEGVFTDGDLRRYILENQSVNPNEVPIRVLMTSDCRFSYITDTPLKTANIMETNQITFMPIVDKDMYVVGGLTMHDLLRNGMK